MKRDQQVNAEPAGNSEAGWSIPSKSTLDLPGFETGEFDSLVKAASTEAPDESAEELKEHMSALIGDESDEQGSAGGEASGEGDEGDGPGLLRRTGGQVVNKLTGR